MKTYSRHLYGAADFARERLGFQPDPDQAQALNPFIRRGLLNCCRQWGKSTTVSIRAVHQAVHHDRSLTIVASPSARQSGEFVRKANDFLRVLGIAAKGDGDNRTSLVLPNGSRIVGLPGREATIRGFSAVSLLLIDEASRVPDELYHAVRPMIAANPDAAIWLMSTPNGRQGFFYDEWAMGGPECKRTANPC
jgi:Terminase large subunit, T4likevirus-type, N-terminal